MKNNEFLPGTNSFWEFSWLLSVIFCPAGPLSGNVDKKFTTIFCPTGPLDGNMIRDSLHLFGFFSNRLSQFFLTQRCTPQTWEVQFSQSRRHALQIRSGGSIFEEPALQATMPQNQGSQFLKSQRFTPQKRVWIFPKPVLRTSKPVVSIFQKHGPRVSKSGTFNFSKACASRLNAAYGFLEFVFQNRLCCIKFFNTGVSRLNTAYSRFNFFKSRRFTPQKIGFEFFQSRYCVPQNQEFPFFKNRCQAFQ